MLPPENPCLGIKQATGPIATSAKSYQRNSAVYDVREVIGEVIGVRYDPRMSCPLRIEFPGAVYHAPSRGDRREPIYRDDEDRTTHLEVIAQAIDRFDAQVLAYCQMGNHYYLVLYHVVLYTRQANLSRLMRHVNGVYTQAFNQRHALVGQPEYCPLRALATILVTVRDRGGCPTVMIGD